MTLVALYLSLGWTLGAWKTPGSSSGGPGSHACACLAATGHPLGPDHHLLPHPQSGRTFMTLQLE